MIVVSNSSPLITLGRSGCLDLLPKLFGRIHVATEVFIEVSVLGAGRPGSQAVRGVNWETLQRIVNRVARLQVIKQALRRHPGANKYGAVLHSPAWGADFGEMASIALFSVFAPSRLHVFPVQLSHSAPPGTGRNGSLHILAHPGIGSTRSSQRTRQGKQHPVET